MPVTTVNEVQTNSVVAPKPKISTKLAIFMMHGQIPSFTFPSVLNEALQACESLGVKNNYSAIADLVQKTTEMGKLLQQRYPQLYAASPKPISAPACYSAEETIKYANAIDGWLKGPGKRFGLEIEINASEKGVV